MGKSDFDEPLMEPVDLPAEEQKSACFYLGNVVHMSSCFLLVFTAFSAIQNLAGTYLFGSLGFLQGTVLYLTFAISCLFGPLVGSILGAKWSLFCGFIGYMVYAGTAMVASLVFVDSTNKTLMPVEWCNGTKSNATDDYCINTTPGWVVEMAGAALCGFCASFLWYAEGVYVTKSADKYRDAVVRQSKGQNAPKDAKGFFNGIFFVFFQLTQITGNLIGSLLLKAGWTFSSICIVYLISAAAGTVLCFFLRPVNSAAERAEETSKSIGDRVKGPMALLFKDGRLPLLVIYMIYSGMEMVFIWSDFTTNYVSPTIGDQMIGYTMAVFGASDAIFSLAIGKLSDIVGQLPMVYLGFVAQLTVLAIFQFYVGWKDDAEVILFICAAVWGIGDAVCNTVMYAIIGSYFKESEVGDAFANLKLWQSLACAAAFTYTRAKDEESTEMRRFIIAGAAALSMVTYTILAIWQKRVSRTAVQQE